MAILLVDIGIFKKSIKFESAANCGTDRVSEFLFRMYEFVDDVYWLVAADSDAELDTALQKRTKREIARCVGGELLMRSIADTATLLQPIVLAVLTEDAEVAMAWNAVGVPTVGAQDINEIVDKLAALTGRREQNVLQTVDDIEIRYNRSIPPQVGKCYFPTQEMRIKHENRAREVIGCYQNQVFFRHVGDDGKPLSNKKKIVTQRAWQDWFSRSKSK